MSNKILVIGKNSRLCRRLLRGYKRAEFFSHSEILEINFDQYELVFLLSFSRVSLDENLALIEKIPPSKLIYASTIANQSLAVRSQWASYPNLKAALEKKVLAAGGRAMRIGIIEEDLGADAFGVVPVTSRKNIIDAFDKFRLNRDQIIEAYSLQSIACTGLTQRIARLMYKFSRQVLNWRVIQIPIAAMMKYLGFSYYGYTADALQCFCFQLQVGFGALGANYYRSGALKSETIIVSPKDTASLRASGFNGTRIGYGLMGLARYWHGVSVEAPPDETGLVSKRVPIWINRRTPPRVKLCYQHVRGIETSELGVLYLDTEDHRRAFCTQRLVLAAGAIENSRVLRSLAPVTCKFSDHEIGHIGDVDGSELIFKGVIRKIGPFAVRRSVIQIADHTTPFLLDFRPRNIKRHMVDPSFYDDTTSSIIKKIIVRWSAQAINEAVFNKFGVSIYTRQFSVFSQIIAHNCITLSDETLIRTRLTLEEIGAVVSRTARELASFRSEEAPNLIDGQHIVGAEKLLDHPKIQELLDKESIVLVGSPTRTPLGPGHHTRRFMIDASA